MVVRPFQTMYARIDAKMFPVYAFVVHAMHEIVADRVHVETSAVRQRERVPPNESFLENGVVFDGCTSPLCIWCVVGEFVSCKFGGISGIAVLAKQYRSFIVLKAMLRVHVEVVFGERELAFPNGAV